MDAWQRQFFPNLAPGTEPPSGEISLIVSILSVGTFVGALMAGIVADKLGRKWGIIASAMIPFNLGVALQTGAFTKSTFIAGRFFAGMGVGLVSVQVPMVSARREQHAEMRSDNTASFNPRPFPSGSVDSSSARISSLSRLDYSLQRWSTTEPRTAWTAERIEFHWESNLVGL